MASNDLGVLLADNGNLGAALAALKHGLSIQPQSNAWRNLAHVYRELGDEDRARRANILATTSREAEIADRKARHGSRHPQVQWVDPGTFAQANMQVPQTRPPAAAQAVAPAPEVPSQPAVDEGQIIEMPPLPAPTKPQSVSPWDTFWEGLFGRGPTPAEEPLDNEYRSAWMNRHSSEVRE
jgi:hypothetical protein